MMVTIISCKKNDSNTVKTLPVKQQLMRVDDEEYTYERVLDATTYGLLDISTNAEIKQTINEEVAKKFDMDDNVLIRTLSEHLAIQGVNLLEEMQSSLIKHGREDLLEYLPDAINGMKYGSDTVYAQIFIPFIEGKDLKGVPTICTNYEDEAILPGVSIKTGDVVATEVDESTAKDELIWVTSFNESVTNRGKIEINTTNQKTSASAYDRDLKVVEVNISDKKEGWGNGRADISFSGAQLINCQMGAQTQAIPFTKIANSDLNSWFTPTGAYTAPWLANGNYGYIYFWNEQSGESVPAVFYEKDIRKKFNRDIVLLGCSNATRHIVSKEAPYGIINPAYGDYPGGVSNPSTKVYALSGAQFKLKGWRNIP